MLPVMRSGSGRGQWECSTHECCAPPGARRSRGPATLVFARPCQSAVYVIAHRGCVHLSTSPMTRLRTARPRGTRRPSTREGSAHCRCEWCDASCLVSAAAAVNAHCCERSRTCLLPPGRALCGAARPWWAYSRLARACHAPSRAHGEALALRYAAMRPRMLRAGPLLRRCARGRRACPRRCRE